MTDHTYGPNLISIAAEIEEHLHVTSIALLHLAFGNSTMEETILAAHAMRLAYRMDEAEEDHQASRSSRVPLRLADAIKVLRGVEQDLDHYGDLTIATVTEFRALLARLDGDTEPVEEKPF